MLSAKDILKSADTPEVKRVELPELSDHVYVRVISGAERDKWEVQAERLLKSPEINVRASLCLLTMCNEKGERLFKDDQLVDLGKVSAIVLERVFQASREINRLRDDDIEELEKNFEAAARGDSGSSLQAI